jgi:hypothetical protein
LNVSSFSFVGEEPVEGRINLFRSSTVTSSRSLCCCTVVSVALRKRRFEQFLPLLLPTVSSASHCSPCSRSSSVSGSINEPVRHLRRFRTPPTAPSASFVPPRPPSPPPLSPSSDSSPLHRCPPRSAVVLCDVRVGKQEEPWFSATRRCCLSPSPPLNQLRLPPPRSPRSRISTAVFSRAF